MSRFFKQYSGLRREAYTLFFGRMMTCLGSTVNSMMSLILANKMGKTAYEIAIIFLIYSAVLIPATIVGGKLADRFNKKNIIIFCDLVTVAAFFIAAMIPLTDLTIVFLLIGSGFASIEFPSYDALVADFTQAQDRERAYSLNYLAANVGIVLAPIIGGFMFENYLQVSFIVNSLATLSSTILIFALIKNVTREVNLNAVYEDTANSASVFKIIKERKVLILFIICCTVSSLVYVQFQHLLPLNLEQLYSAKGAMYFGLLTSLNAITVVIGTPFLTIALKKVKGVTKMIVGDICIALSFVMYIFIQGIIPLFFVAMVLFTVGEIVATLGRQPYLTQRVPASHRGRISSIFFVATTAFQMVVQLGIAQLVDTIAIVQVWAVVVAIAVFAILFYIILKRFDKKAFPKLYL